MPPRDHSQRQYLTNAMDMAKAILDTRIQPGDTLIDATMGNGYDTVFLARKTGPKGIVIAFDIQATALENTKHRLEEQGLSECCRLIEASHSRMTEYIHEKVKAILFNLGYLPGENRELFTRAGETLKAILNGLDLLADDGIMLIVNYRGHEEGKSEQNKLDRELSRIEQKRFTIARIEFLNQKNDPPALYLIERNQKYL